MRDTRRHIGSAAGTRGEDPNHKSSDGELLLRDPAGLREEPDVHVPILLDREVPKNPNNGGKDPTYGPKRSAKREVGEKEEEETAPVPDADPEGIRAAVGAKAKALDPPLRQPRDRFHLRIVRVSHSGAHRSLALALARREVNQTKQQRRFAPVMRKGSSISFDTFG